MDFPLPLTLVLLMTEDAEREKTERVPASAPSEKRPSGVYAAAPKSGVSVPAAAATSRVA